VDKKPSVEENIIAILEARIKRKTFFVFKYHDDRSKREVKETKEALKYFKSLIQNNS
jgi:hypothetical protein